MTWAFSLFWQNLIDCAVTRCMQSYISHSVGKYRFKYKLEQYLGTHAIIRNTLKRWYQTKRWLLIFFPSVTLYNCSMGREDCSLCKYADPKYRCVWCSKQKACVYEKLCAQQQGDPHDIECPNPEINNVSSGNKVVVTSCLLFKQKLCFP